MVKTIGINEKTKELLDNCKVIPDQSYNSVIKMLCEKHKGNSSLGKQEQDKTPSEKNNSGNFSEPKPTQDYTTTDTGY